jgi:hypothetical protein
MLRIGMRSYLEGAGVLNPTEAMVTDALHADTQGALQVLIPELVEDAQALADRSVQSLLAALIYAFDRTVPRGEPRPVQMGVVGRAVTRELKAAVAALDRFAAELESTSGL